MYCWEFRSREIRIDINMIIIFLKDNVIWFIVDIFIRNNRFMGFLFVFLLCVEEYIGVVY